MSKEKPITDEELEALTAPPVFVTETVPDPQPAALIVVKPEKDADGNRWTAEHHDGSVTVYLTTKDGLDINNRADTEEEARSNLRRTLAYLHSLIA